MNLNMKESITKTQSVVIWLHGLGSSAEDMAGLADALTIENASLRYVFLSAPIRAVTINHGMKMPAWYDILGTSLLDRQDYQGLTESQQMLNQTINQEIANGVQSHNIYIAGFSQGAAVALYAGLSYPKPLGGLMILSGYLPCREQLKYQQHLQIPIFVGVGLHDDMVQPVWSYQSMTALLEQGYQSAQLFEYAMGHSVCIEEIQDISTWLQARIQSPYLSSLEVL